MAHDHGLTPAAATALIATLDEGVVMQEADGSIVFANPAAQRILGLTADQLAGRTSLDPRWQARHEDGSDWPGDDHPIMHAIRDGVCVEGAVMDVRHASGRRVWISINARPVIESGRIVAGISTFRDVTQERLAADHASANVRQLLDALHESGLAVATSDDHGHLLSANPGFADMVARPIEQLLGMHFTEFSGPDALPAQLDAVERFNAGATNQFQTFKTYVRPDGSHRFALMNLLALRDADGALVRHVSLVHDITEQVHNEATLAAEARTDPLTGILNRRGVLDALDAALRDTSRHPLLVAFVDLDGFKEINDRFGHDVGDLVLTQLTKQMNSVIRRGDVLGRMGGDEFVVIYHQSPAEAAERLRQTLLHAVESVSFPGSDVPVSASIGIVAAEPGDLEADVLRRADAAMYEIKKASALRRRRTAAQGGIAGDARADE